MQACFSLRFSVSYLSAETLVREEEEEEKSLDNKKNVRVILRDLLQTFLKFKVSSKKKKKTTQMKIPGEREVRT